MIYQEFLNMQNKEIEQILKSNEFGIEEYDPNVIVANDNLFLNHVINNSKTIFSTERTSKIEGSNYRTITVKIYYKSE